MIRSVLIIALLSIALGSLAQLPIIKTITPLSNEVKLYEKFEAKVDLTATYTNPYDYDEVSLRAAITRPDGKRDTIDGYYSLPFAINTSNGNLTAAGGASFYIRYSPSVIGEHGYELILRDKNGSTVSTQRSFQAMFNAGGRLVAQENVQSDGRFSIRMQSDLPEGVYFVKLNNDRGEAVVKGIVVSK